MPGPTETEADTRANRIDPMLREAGWGVVEGSRVHRELICPGRITGGGFLEDIPRILPEGGSVVIKRGAWQELPIFGLMQKLGNVSDSEMFRTFNMGVGMIVICDEGSADELTNKIENSVRIGRVVEGEKVLSII